MAISNLRPIRAHRENGVIKVDVVAFINVLNDWLPELAESSTAEANFIFCLKIYLTGIIHATVAHAGKAELKEDEMLLMPAKYLIDRIDSGMLDNIFERNEEAIVKLKSMLENIEENVVRVN